MSGHSYRGFGLLIRSELALPEFPPAPGGGTPDVTVRLGAPAGSAAGETADGYVFRPAAGGGFAMNIPGHARYLVRDGREIVVTPEDGGDPGLVRLYTLGSAFGMLLHQRGVLVMHGSTIAAGVGAAIVVGPAGAGKSTLAAQLGRAGRAVLGDDTMPIWPRPGGGFEVRAGSRVSKLWGDTLDNLGVARDGLEAVANRLEKFYCPNPAGGAEAVLPLSEILVLDTHGGPPEIRPLDRLGAVAAIAAHTYRPEYLDLLGRRAGHFRQCAALAAAVPVARLVRPDAFTRASETVALLEDRWRGPAPARSRTG